MADEPPSLAILRRATSARVGLGRVGQGLPTAPMLAFQLAQARARDAVHAPLDVERVSDAVSGPSIVIRSSAPDRATYLQNPDLGRRLNGDDPHLAQGDYDLAVVIADGLSATAVHEHAGAVVQALRQRLTDWTIAPVVVALQARVAIGDPIGEALGARVVVMLIGERPGLSAVNSLGAYVTWDPKSGRRDSDRNCISNIRSPGGLPPEQAANKIAWLLRETKRLGFSGVSLKDRQFSAAIGDE